VWELLVWSSPIHRLEAHADGGLEDAQWPVWRCLAVPWSHSARDGAVVPGMVAHRRGWPHSAEVTEKTCPAGLTSRHRLARARGRHLYLFRGFRRPPSRGATWESYESGRHGVTDFTQALPHSSRTGRVGGTAPGYNFQAVSGCQRGGDSPLTLALASCQGIS
jgi:hypothetical protein